MAESKFPHIKVTISKENEHFVMLHTLLYLYSHSQSIMAMFIPMYAKVMNVTFEEAKKLYQELQDQSVTEMQALFSKFGDVDIRP